jgi:hypothetical protein
MSNESLVVGVYNLSSLYVNIAGGHALTVSITASIAGNAYISSSLDTA